MSWFGVSVQGAPYDEGAMDAFDESVGRPPALHSWFANWTGPFPRAEAAAVEARGALPVLTWEPVGQSLDDPAYAPERIAQGDHDEYLRRWAADAAAWCGLFLVRLAPEMNANWINWGVGRHGTSPADFVAMWRHVVDLFRAAGALNVRWVWAPNELLGDAASEITGLYPGDGWVDWMGVDGYNWGTVNPWNRWRSFDEVFGPTLGILAGLSSRPVMLGEVASTEQGGDKAAWLADFFTQLGRRPQIRAWVWFNHDKETDWTVGSSPGSLVAFGEGVKSAWIGSAPASPWFNEPGGG